MVMFAVVWSSLELGCISGFLCSPSLILFVAEFPAFLMRFLISKIIASLLEINSFRIKLQKFHGPGNAILLE